jgi:ferredoxin-type protein NapG
MECTRRHFFGQLGRSLVADLVDAVDSLRAECDSLVPDPANEPAAASWIRPPGALPETEFLSTCTRCTACQEACPYQSIRRLGPEMGLVAGTPAIIPDESPCYLCEDFPCVAACEPKALVAVARINVRMGLAVIAEARCYAAQGQPCDYCVVRCPLRSTAIRFDDRGIPVIQESGCTGCGVCAYLCPARAITIVSKASN